MGRDDATLDPSIAARHAGTGTIIVAGRAAGERKLALALGADHAIDVGR